VASSPLGRRPYDLHHVAGLAERYGLVNALARKPLTASAQTRACKFRLDEMTTARRDLASSELA
jgi:hypothetical protein